MFKRLIISTFILVSAFFVMAQSNPDTLSYGETPDCETIAYNSTNLIMYFYTIQDYDSVDIVLNSWQSACGISEPIFRTRILFAILQNSFNEGLYDSTISDYVSNYMNRKDTANLELYNDYKEYFGFLPLMGDYDYFTQNLAYVLLSRVQFENPIAKLLCQVYADKLSDPVKEIQELTNYENRDTIPTDHKDVTQSREKSFSHSDLISGIWVPYGNASVLGVHPIFGFQLGKRYGDLTYNLTFAFRFVGTPNEYYVSTNGIIDTTNYYFGGYIGIDFDKEIFTGKKSEFDLLAGIGYDGFETLNWNTQDNNPGNDRKHTLKTLNINFGLGYRYFLNARRYIGLQVKYNIVNYNNKGGTDFSGDCITISFLLGKLRIRDSD